MSLSKDEQTAVVFDHLVRFAASVDMGVPSYDRLDQLLRYEVAGANVHEDPQLVEFYEAARKYVKYQRDANADYRKPFKKGEVMPRFETLEWEWEEFRDSALSEDSTITPEAMENIKRVFYAGMLGMFTWLTVKAAEEGGLTPEEGGKMIMKIKDEFRRFAIDTITKSSRN